MSRREEGRPWAVVACGATGGVAGQVETEACVCDECTYVRMSIVIAGTRECWGCCLALSSSSELISRNKPTQERYNGVTCECRGCSAVVHSVRTCIRTYCINVGTLVLCS